MNLFPAHCAEDPIKSQGLSQNAVSIQVRGTRSWMGYKEACYHYSRLLGC